MKRYINTVANPETGEWIEMLQLAEVMEAEVVHTVPPSGLLVYMSNLNVRAHLEMDDLEALAARKAHRRGGNIVIAGPCPPWEDAAKFRTYYELLGRIADVIFVHHPAQVDYLKQYDVAATLKPMNEKRYSGSAIFKPNTVLYSGFYWEEKDLGLFITVARLLPDWQFTLQIGQEALAINSPLPPNCEFLKKFIPDEEYLEFLAQYEYIWLPRKTSQLIYAARSGLSAVASGRPTLLPDIAVNAIIPDGVALKYRPDWKPQHLAKLFSKGFRPKAETVDKFVDSIQPTAVWTHMQKTLKVKEIKFS